jgi:4-amino-4-deoxy-L-arabinose transferase-like glycosyltransferase
MSLFGTNLLVMRVISIIFGLGVVVITYGLGKYLYGQKIGILSAIFILSFPLIVRLGSAGLLDVQVTFLFGLSLLLFFMLLDEPSWLLAILLGVTLGAGLLTKYTMFLIFPVLFFLALIRRKILSRAIYLVLAVLIAGSFYVLWLYQADQYNINAPGIQLINLIQRDVASTSTNSSSVAPTETSPTSSNNPLEGNISEGIRIGWFLLSADGWKILANIIFTQLSSAIGPYNFPLLVLGLWILIRRREISDWIILIWIIVFSAILILTIPDHRYFMALFPALAITMSAWIKSNPVHGERVIGLTLFYWVGALYLFIDWYRVGPLFGNH